jgi:hypothetical protein
MAIWRARIRNLRVVHATQHQRKERVAKTVASNTSKEEALKGRMKALDSVGSEEESADLQRDMDRKEEELKFRKAELEKLKGTTEFSKALKEEKWEMTHVLPDTTHSERGCKKTAEAVRASGVGDKRKTTGNSRKKPKQDKEETQGRNSRKKLTQGRNSRNKINVRLGKVKPTSLGKSHAVVCAMFSKKGNAHEHV